MTVFYYDSELPTSLQWNIGTQMTLPWSSSLDVSYVGSHAYNILGQNPDINAPDIGVAYLPQNQDPTLSSATPGGAALTTDLMRPYRGLGAINTTWGKNWNGYDSIQMSLNRRFRDGVQATLNYTRSLRTIGNTGQGSAGQSCAFSTTLTARSRYATTRKARRVDAQHRQPAARHPGQFRVGAPRHGDRQRRVESHRRRHQRLAALGRLHRHVRDRPTTRPTRTTRAAAT